MSAGREEGDDPWAVSHLVVARRLLAEACGTSALVFVDCGGAVIGEISGGEVGFAARSAATGLTVFVISATFGDVSGAHLNPAVSLAFALRRVFPWTMVPLYWISQLGGALLSALLLRAMFGTTAHLGAPQAHYGLGRAFVFESVLTIFLVAACLGAATKHQLLGSAAGLVTGGTVALDSLFARPVSGAAMNPARAIAPALVAGEASSSWIYVVAPLVGAVLATLAMAVLHPHRHGAEREAAGGERK